MTCTSLTSIGEPPEVCSGGNLFTWLKALYYAVCELIDDLTASVASSGIPVGSMVDYGGSSAPSGWLLADGSAVSRATYAALFAVYGTTYGSGDGSTTFNLPDRRGRIGVGKDNMGGTSANRITGSWADTLGGTGGAETHTLTTNELAVHSHTVNTWTGGSNTTANISGAFNNTTQTVNGSATNNAGGGQAHNNIQPSIALNVIIKY